MNDNLLTRLETARAALTAAQERSRSARRRESRLAREIQVTDRKLAAQQKIVLGAALLRAVEQQPQHLPALKRLLDRFVTRSSDRNCLHGTPFDFDAETEENANE